MNLLRSLSVVSLSLVSLTAHSGVMLTADVYDTPGLPGYQTFDLTASSSVGYLNGFDFTNSGLGGITGPLHQGAAPGGDPMASYTADMLFGGLSGDVADSHWLVDAADGFSVKSSQSESELAAAFVFGTASGLRDTYRSLPFARIVTNDPSTVLLQGEFLVKKRYDHMSIGFGAAITEPLEMVLSDVSTGGLPTLGAFSDPFGPDAATVASDPAAAHQAEYMRGRAAAAEIVSRERLGLFDASYGMEKYAREEERKRASEKFEAWMNSPEYLEMIKAEAEAAMLAGAVEELPPVLHPPVVQPIEQVTPPIVPEPPTVEPTEEMPPATEPVVVPTEVVVWPSEPLTLPEYLGKGNVWQHPYWNEQCIVYTEPFAIGVGAWQVIDVTSEIDLEVIELSDFVTTRGVVSGEPVFINVAYDSDASSLAFATDAVVELGATPEPTTAVLLLLAVCGSVRYRRG